MISDLAPFVDYSACGFSASIGGLVALFEIYCDESESESDSSVTIAGWAADINRLATLSIEWKNVLAQYQVSFFHTKTFKNRQSRMYRHLSKQDRQGLLDALLGLINQYASHGQSVQLSKKLYHRLTTKEFRTRHGSPYATCLGICTWKVGFRITNGLTAEQELSVFLEDGHANATESIWYLQRYKELSASTTGYDEVWGKENSPIRDSPLKIGAIGLGSKRSMPALQAADILAYCSGCVMRNPKDDFAAPILNALSAPDIRFYQIDAGDLNAMTSRLAKEDASEVRIQHTRRAQKHRLKELGITFRELPDGIEVEIPEDEVEAKEVRRLLGH